MLEWPCDVQHIGIAWGRAASMALCAADGTGGQRCPQCSWPLSGGLPCPEAFLDSFLQFSGCKGALQHPAVGCLACVQWLCHTWGGGGGSAGNTSVTHCGAVQWGEASRDPPSTVWGTPLRLLLPVMGIHMGAGAVSTPPHTNTQLAFV